MFFIWDPVFSLLLLGGGCLESFTCVLEWVLLSFFVV